MKLASPYFNTLIEINDGEIFQLVIENQKLFRTFAEDIHRQICGDDGNTVLSVNNVPVSMSKFSDLIENFAPFDINTKTVLSRITSAMEKTAVDENHFLQTSGLLADIENYMTELCFNFPFGVECRKLNISSLIKSASVCVIDDNTDALEIILDYMSLVLDFDKKKLFITVNMRSYFDDDGITSFANAVRCKQMQVLMLESTSRSTVEGMKQLIIDRDLCEF